MDKIILELPPFSANNSHINRMGSYKRIMRPETRVWMESAILHLTSWRRKNKFIPKDDFFYIDLHFFLKDKRSDSHNYKKQIFDAMERGGLVVNDKFIMDRTQSIDYDRLKPRVEITVV